MGDVFVFDYHCFLSAKDRRHLNIIEYLVFKENYISVYEIEKLNQCSNRTVYNDIEEIYQRFGKQLDASFSKNVLKIRNISSGNYEQIQKKILNKSTEINVMKTVFEKSNVTVEELAKLNGISESYAYRILTKVRKSLKKHQINIKGRYLKFEADSEQKLRLFLTDLYFQSSFYREMYPVIADKDQVWSLIGKEFSDDHILNNDYLKFYLMLYLDISLQREDRGYTLVPELEELKTVAIPEIFKNKYKNITKEQFSYVVSTVLQINDCTDKILKDKENLTILFEESLSEEHFKISFIDIDRTLESLIFVLCFTQSENIEGLKVLRRSQFYVQKLARTKHYYYNKIRNVLMKTFKNYHYLDNWEQVLDLLISIFMIENPTHISTYRKSILVTSDFSFVHAESIKVFMEYYFEDHFYETIPIKKLRNADQAMIDKIEKEFDYIVTTVHLEDIVQEKQIVVDDVFNEHDLMKFYTKLYD